MRSITEDTLFKQRFPRARIALATLATVAIVLGISTSAIAILAALALSGWMLLGFYWWKGFRKFLIPWPLLFAAALTFCASAIFFTDFIDWVMPLWLRVASGIAWISTLSLSICWSDVRRFAARWGWLQDVAELADTAVAHGFILMREFVRRRDIAYLRLFRAGKKRLGVQELSWALAGGVERGFSRIVRVEEARSLRLGVFRNPAQAAPEAEDHSVLKYSDVSVSSDERLQLDHVSLTFSDGEWVLLAGPSGAGKTTLLRVACGLTPIVSGKVNGLGRCISEGVPLHRRVHRDIGFVCQDPLDQILGSTPIEDVALGIMARGMTEAQAQLEAQSMLERLGIGSLSNRPIMQLSHGERKRVAFAAILACRPRIVLCDEPTSGLDPVAAQTLIAALEETTMLGHTTVIWATHDLMSLPRQITRAVLLKQGRVFFDGALRDGLSSDRLQSAGLQVKEGSCV